MPRTWLADTVKLAPALVKLFGVSGLFTHAEPMETSTTKLANRPNFDQKAPAGFERSRPLVLGIWFLHQNVPESV